jgi:diadenylate cyclase
MDGGIGSIFQQISFKDLLDISIVSYIIYKIIMLVRGTRAIQLLRGILVLVLVWGGSIYLNLYTLQWMMNQIFTFGVLAVVIIFQPELRRALERIGRGTFFSRGPSESEHEINRVISDVVKAVHHMSQHKTGALIVFERETGLNEYVESGVSMQAKISAELLLNLFTPNTPLHDGAVIIRQNQLAAAGCYLPLSENSSLSKELGTRHRAAIGISEVSDCIAVVVSEETGSISLAINGLMTRQIIEEKLITKLFEEMKSAHKSKERVPFWKWKGTKNG